MVVLGGVLGSVALVAVLAAASAHWPKVSSVLGTLALAQAILIAFALWPWTTSIGPSDGMRLWLLRKPPLDMRGFAHDLAKAVFPDLEAGSQPIPFEAAVEMVRQVARSDWKIDAYAAEDREATLRYLLDSDQIPAATPERALILDTLLVMEACNVRTGASPGNILAWSTEFLALAGAGKAEVLHGMALLMNGQHEAGQTLLQAAYEKPQDGFEAALNCAFLAQAAALRGDEAGVRQWMNVIRAWPDTPDSFFALPNHF